MAKIRQKEQRELLRLRRQVGKTEQALAELDRHLMTEEGICPSDLSILERLSRKGAQTVNGLGQRIGLTSGSITTAVQRLRKRGLVETRREEEDRRVVLVAATGEGRELAKRVNARRTNAFAEIFSLYSERERDLLQNLMKRLRRDTAGFDREGLGVS